MEITPNSMPLEMNIEPLSINIKAMNDAIVINEIKILVLSILKFFTPR